MERKIGVLYEWPEIGLGKMAGIDSLAKLTVQTNGLTGAIVTRTQMIDMLPANVAWTCVH